MNIRTYIATKNPKGVRDWAVKNGYGYIVNDSDSALKLLNYLYDNNNEEAKVIFSELHPDNFLFKKECKECMKKEEKTPQYNNCCGCNDFSNAIGLSQVQMKHYMRSDGVDLDRATSAVKETYSDIKDSIKDRDDRIFKYGVILISGILIGKFLLK